MKHDGRTARPANLLRWVTRVVKDLEAGQRENVYLVEFVSGQLRVDAGARVSFLQEGRGNVQLARVRRR